MKSSSSTSSSDVPTIRLAGTARRRVAAARRGRNAVVWGFVFFVLAQVGLLAVLSYSRTLRDPEYGRRLVELSARLEENPGRPLIVLLGSSRTALNIRPEVMDVNQQGATGPILFNMGLCQGGPMMQLWCLQRLLEDGVRPKVIIAEIWPHVMCYQSGEEQTAVTIDRLTWSDVCCLSPYYADPARLRREWIERNLIPWHGERVQLIGHVKPRWVNASKRPKDLEWMGMTAWGWVQFPAFVDRPHEPPVHRDARFADVASGHRAAAENYRLSDLTQRAFKRMAELCAAHKIELVFAMLPDPFLNDYSPAARARMEEMVCRVSRDLGAPLIDARTWAEREDFYEGVHYTHQGAIRASRRFEQNLKSCLEGRPFASRWPVGRLTSGLPD